MVLKGLKSHFQLPLKYGQDKVNRKKNGWFQNGGKRKKINYPFKIKLTLPEQKNVNTAKNRQCIKNNQC